MKKLYFNLTIFGGLMFKERLRLLREERGLSKVELANDMNLGRGAISYYENGREPSYEILKKIAYYFAVTTDYLTGYSDYRSLDDKVMKIKLNEHEIKSGFSEQIQISIDEILELIRILLDAFPIPYYASAQISKDDLINLRTTYLSRLCELLKDLSIPILRTKYNILYEFRTEDAVDDYFYSNISIHDEKKFKYYDNTPNKLMYMVYKSLKQNNKEYLDDISSSLTDLIDFIFEHYYNVCYNNFTSKGDAPVWQKNAETEKEVSSKEKMEPGVPKSQQGLTQQRENPKKKFTMEKQERRLPKD